MTPKLGDGLYGPSTYPLLLAPPMTTPQRDRLRLLARNDQPVTLSGLIAMWHCSRDTARSTLALCGYVLAGGAWHHPDHVPVSSQSPVSSEQTMVTEVSPPAAPTPFGLEPSEAKPAPRPLLPTPTGRRSVKAPLPLWLTCEPADLLADLEATSVTRTWLLANVEPANWPHPHRTPCHDCKLWQPCLTLSRHRQATICEAVIAQRRLSNADVPIRPDIYGGAARCSSPGQENIRDVHPAQNAVAAAY